MFKLMFLFVFIFFVNCSGKAGESQVQSDKKVEPAKKNPLVQATEKNKKIEKVVDMKEVKIPQKPPKPGLQLKKDEAKSLNITEIKNDPFQVSVKIITLDKADQNLKTSILHDKIIKLMEELKKAEVKDYNVQEIFNKHIPGSDKSLHFPTDIKKVHFVLFKKEFLYGFIAGFNDITNQRCKDTETIEVFVRQLGNGKPYLSARNIENENFSLITAARRTLTIQDVEGAGKVFNLEFGLSSADLCKNGVPVDKSCGVAGDTTYKYMRTWVFNSGVLTAEKQITTRVETLEPGKVDSEERIWQWMTIDGKGWLITNYTKKSGNVGTGIDEKGNYDTSRDVSESSSIGAISPQKNGAWKMASKKDLENMKKSSPAFASYCK